MELLEKSFWSWSVLKAFRFNPVSIHFTNLTDFFNYLQDTQFGLQSLKVFDISSRNLHCFLLGFGSGCLKLYSDSLIDYSESDFLEEFLSIRIEAVIGWAVEVRHLTALLADFDWRFAEPIE